VTYALRLPRALERFGLDVEVVPGWEKRGSASFNPAASVGHHTAGSRSGDRPSLAICTNGRSDLSGPLCNTFTTRPGLAVVVAAGRANHAGLGGFRGLVGNSSVYGHEAEHSGSTSEPWDPAHLRAYPRVHAAHLYLAEVGADYYCSHRTWALTSPSWPGRKTDPVAIFDTALRAQIAELLKAGRDTDNLPVPPTPPPVEAPPFPLPEGSYFGSKSGPAESVSGYYSHREDLARWQRRMRQRGWTLKADGLFGAVTGEVARQFRVQEGLEDLPRVNAGTWSRAWTSPVVP